jgi:hypothetical protein
MFLSTFCTFCSAGLCCLASDGGTGLMACVSFVSGGGLCGLPPCRRLCCVAFPQSLSVILYCSGLLARLAERTGLRCRFGKEPALHSQLQPRAAPHVPCEGLSTIGFNPIGSAGLQPRCLASRSVPPESCSGRRVHAQCGIAGLCPLFCRGSSRNGGMW